MILHEFVSWHLDNQWFRLSGLSVTGKKIQAPASCQRNLQAKDLKNTRTHWYVYLMYVCGTNKIQHKKFSVENICNSTSVLPLFSFCLMVFHGIPANNSQPPSGSSSRADQLQLLSSQFCFHSIEWGPGPPLGPQFQQQNFDHTLPPAIDDQMVL